MATTLILLIAMLACWFIARMMKSFKTFIIAIIAILLGFTVGVVCSEAKTSKKSIKEHVISNVTSMVTLDQALFVMREDTRLTKPVSKPKVYNRSNMITDSNVIRQLPIVVENPKLQTPEWFNDS